MSPFNSGFPPASWDLGHEIDLLLTYSLTARTEIQVGYSHFFAGRYYKETQFTPTDPPNFSRHDADFFYTHFLWNF